MLNTINKFKDQTGRTSLRFSHQICQTDDVWTTRKDLQDLNFTTNLLAANGFKNFDDVTVIGFDVDTGKDFRVLALTHLLQLLGSRPGDLSLQIKTHNPNEMGVRGR